MTDKALVCFARLGDHLGLSAIVTAAAKELVKLPWHNNLYRLAVFLQMPVYKHKQEKLIELLHHPQRGAYSELQVLQLLESLSYDDADIAAVVQLDIMQPAELKVLLGILVSVEHSAQGMLLHKAVQQHIRCEDARAQILEEEEAHAMYAKQADSPTRCIPKLRSASLMASSQMVPCLMGPQALTGFP